MQQWPALCPGCGGEYRDAGDYYACECPGEDGLLDPRDIQTEWDERHETINGILTIIQLDITDED